MIGRRFGRRDGRASSVALGARAARGARLVRTPVTRAVPVGRAPRRTSRLSANEDRRAHVRDLTAARAGQQLTGLVADLMAGDRALTVLRVQRGT